MTRLRSQGFPLSSLPLCLACGGAEPPVAAPSAPPPPPPAPMTAIAPPPAASAPPSEYRGHGLESLTPELLARYRPRELPPDVARELRVLLDLSVPSAGQLSPDGKRLWFGWGVTGVPQVWRVDGPLRFPVQATAGEDATFLSDVSPDGRWIVLSRDRKGEENPGLYLQAAEGGPLQLVQHLPGVRTQYHAFSDDSRFLYFTSNDLAKDSYAVHRWNVEKKERETLLSEPGLWTVSDLRADGALLLTRATGALTREVWQLAPGRQKPEPLFGQDVKEEHEVLFGARAGDVLVRTNRFGEFRRLYRWREGKFEPLGEEVKADVASFSLDRKRTRLLYTLNEGGFTRPRALDPATGRALPLPRLPDADHVYWGATTPNGAQTTLLVDDGKGLPGAWVLDWRSRLLTRWHVPGAPELDPSGFARASLETYPARDGTPIPVLVRRPRKCAATPCPVVVHFHGGPEAQSRPGFNVHAQAFLDAGFVFVEPNVRGSDGYGKSWLAADDGPKRLDIITDIEDAAKWARARFAEGGQTPKLGVYGGSYGGYSVLMAMTLFAGAYDAGVNVVGISDLRTFLRNTAPYRRALRISEYGDPEKDAEALAKLSPMTYVDRVQGPLLILQGATDPRVPAHEAVQIHEAFQRRGLASDLMIFPDEGHGARKRDNRVLMLGHSVAFFRKHLAGR